MASQDHYGEKNEENSENNFKPHGQPNSSNMDSLHPEQTSHNMNDLKTLDFNSADEIRQTMKAVLASKGPPHEDPENCVSLKTNVGIETNSVKRAQESTQSPSVILAKQKIVQIEAEKNVQGINHKNGKGSPNVRRKRPGRPPKAGTSKKIKRASVTALYLGKLSNVVPFKRRRFGSGSESDDFTLVNLY